MKILAAALLVLVPLVFPARADDAHPLVDGLVRKVDKDAQKITIRHGPIPSLDMPMPMTMVYRVEDPALLEKVKAGDKVRFEAENANGTYTVTTIERAR